VIFIEDMFRWHLKGKQPELTVEVPLQLTDAGEDEVRQPEVKENQSDNEDEAFSETQIQENQRNKGEGAEDYDIPQRQARYLTREKIPRAYFDYILYNAVYFSNSKVQPISKALSCNVSDLWKRAMQEENILKLHGNLSICLMGNGLSTASGYLKQRKMLMEMLACLRPD
jgi:hypothetical protein